LWSRRRKTARCRLWAEPQGSVSKIFFAESLAEAECRGEIRGVRDRLALARFLTNTLFGLRVTAKTRAGAQAIRAIVETTLGFIEKG
jgi:hypothetical protein